MGTTWGCVRCCGIRGRLAGTDLFLRPGERIKNRKLAGDRRSCCFCGMGFEAQWNGELLKKGDCPPSCINAHSEDVRIANVVRFLALRPVSVMVRC
jgi:hypothetical protein